MLDTLPPGSLARDASPSCDERVPARLAPHEEDPASDREGTGVVKVLTGMDVSQLLTDIG